MADGSLKLGVFVLMLMTPSCTSFICPRPLVARTPVSLPPSRQSAGRRFLYHNSFKTESMRQSPNKNALDENTRFALIPHCHSDRDRRSKIGPLALSTSELEDLECKSGLIGEDAAVFAFEDQSLNSWTAFLAVLGTVLTSLYYLWLNSETGYGDDFVHAIERLSGGNSTIAIALILGIFAVSHSGLASLRPKGEELIGARAWRVLFGVVSLPLAVTSVAYFINHRYDGIHLWDIKMVPGVHEACWIASFVSFFLLYPSTFNLLEVAAVDKPQLHMWETGVMRITRHPQTIGQAIWCLAHLAWVGTSFTAVTTAGLMAHHIFSMWNGDRRLKEKHGEEFEAVRERTSIFPFQAVWEGRQHLPSDYWKEFARGPYLIIAGGTVAAYFAHPFMQAGSYYLGI